MKQHVIKCDVFIIFRMVEFPLEVSPHTEHSLVKAGIFVIEVCFFAKSQNKIRKKERSTDTHI